MSDLLDDFGVATGPLPATAQQVGPTGGRVPDIGATLNRLPKASMAELEAATPARLANTPPSIDPMAGNMPTAPESEAPQLRQETPQLRSQPEFTGTSPGNLFKNAAPGDLLDDFQVPETVPVPQQNNDAFAAGLDLTAPQSGEAEQVKLNVDSHQQQMDLLASTRFTPDQLATFKSNPISFWEGFTKLKGKQVVPGGGIKSGIDALGIADIAKRKERGEELTPADTQKLNDFLDHEVELNQRGFTWGGKIAYYGAQIPAFAIELALTDGVGKITATGAVKAAERAGVNAAVKTATGVATRLATNAVLMAPAYTAKYGEMRLNDTSAVTDKGQLVFKEGEEAPAKSALKAFAYTAGDAAAYIYGGPLIGKALEPVAGAVSKVTNVAKTPLISAVNNLPAALRDGLYQAYKVINPNAQVSKIFTALHWPGMIEQLGANEVARVFHATTNLAADKNYNFDHFMDEITPAKDQLMVEGGLVAIGGGISAATHLTTNILKSRGVDAKTAEQTVNQMSAAEKEAFVQHNIEPPTSEYPQLSIDELEAAHNQGILATHQSVTGMLETLRAPPAAPKTTSLLSFIKSQGGIIDAGGDVKAMDAIRQRPGIVNKNGRTLDDMALAAQEAGYLGGDSYANRADINGLLDAISGELSGKKVYTQADHEALQSHNDKIGAAGDLQRVLDDAGLHHGMTDIDIIKGLGLDAETIYRQGFYQSPDTREIYYDMPDGGQKSGENITSDAKIIGDKIAALEKTDPPPINSEESIGNFLYRKVVHDKIAAEEPYRNAITAGVEVPRMKNTPLLLSLHNNVSELIRDHLMVNTFKWDENGYPVVTGKAIKPILDDFDNMFLRQEPKLETRRQDFEDYLLAKHYLNIKGNLDDVLVTDKQVAKSQEDLARIADKYGENVQFFETFAQEFYDASNNTRDMLVGSLLTQKQRDAEKARYPNYVPLKREMDEVEYQGSISKGDYSGLHGADLKQKLKGSEREVKDILYSTIRNAARTIDYVSKNRILGSIYDLKDFAPDKVQVLKPQLQKVGDATVTYDKGLRAQLDAAIETMGGKVEQLQKVPGGKGMGNVRGSYDPMEKTVRLRIGTNDGVRAHELGHMIDDVHGLGEKLLADAEIKKELLALSQERLPLDDRTNLEDPNIDQGKYQKYIQSDPEVVANFFDGYVNARQLVDNVAPKAAALMDKLVETEPDLQFLKEIKPTLERGEEKVAAFDYKPLPENALSFMRDGKRIDMQLSKPIYEGLMSMRPTQLTGVEKFIQAGARVALGAASLRFGATQTPEFMLRNIVRDTAEATVQSGVGYNPSFIPRAMYNLIGKTDLYHQWRESGGAFGSFMALDDGNIEHIFQDILNPKRGFAALINRPLEKLEYPNKLLEQTTRMGVYLAGLKQGLSPIEAAQAGLDATLNFPRGGKWTKEANKYIPFLNVGVQATDKLFRAFREDPAAMTARGVGYLTLPAVTVAGYYLYGADEKTRKEFLEIPAWQASSRINFKIGDSWHYVPVPYAIGYAFSGVPTLIMRDMAKDRPDDGKKMWVEILKGSLGALSPINDYSAILPPMIKTLVEDVTNYSFFRGDTLYPKYLEGDETAPEDKKNQYDSQTSQALGKALGVSPTVLDNTVYGVTGGLGRYGLDASDWVINKIREHRGEEVPAKPQTDATTPVIRAFSTADPSGKRSNSFQGFDKHLADATAAGKHYKNLTGTERDNYYKKNADLLSALPQLKASAKQIKALTKQKAAIYGDTKMTGKEKAAALKPLDAQITEIAYKANISYNRANR